MATYLGITTHLAYDMFSCINTLLSIYYFPSFFSFFFSFLSSGNFFLIAPFPDHCLILPLDHTQVIAMSILKTKIKSECSPSCV